MSMLLAPSRHANYYNTIMQDDPAVYWQQDDPDDTTVMKDSGPYGRNGSFVGVPNPQQMSLINGGLVGRSVRYVVGKYAEMPYAAWMVSAPFSASAVICPDGVVGTQTIMSQYDGSDSGNYAASRWVLRLDAAKLAVYIFTASGAFKTVASAASLVAGGVYHVGCSYDGTTAKVFLNGVMSSVAMAGTTMLTAGRVMRIARSGNTTSEPFVGYIDEVAWFPSALPDARFLAQYQASLP